MKITIAAVGRLKAGPERDLIERYLDRTNGSGKRLGLSVTVREFPESRAGNPATRKAEEAAALLAALPSGAVLVALDEHGTSIDSPAFAGRIGRWRDDGVSDLVIAIGGADGHGRDVHVRAAFQLAFGVMTWPHQLVRLMISEQIYRATTILSGHPYHRD